MFTSKDLEPDLRSVACGKNMFGKSVFDYKHITDLGKTNPGIMNAKIRRMLKGRSGHTIEKNIFRTMAFDSESNNFVWNPNHPYPINKINFKDALAQGITWLRYNVQAVQAEIEEIFYSKFRLYDYFPIKTNIPEGAQSYIYQVVNSFGQASFIESMGTNANTASIAVSDVTYPMQLGGIDAVWSRDNLKIAIESNIPLDSKTIEAATVSCMQHIEQVGIGTAQDAQSANGLIRNALIPLNTQPAQWNTLTPDQVIGILQQLTSNIIDNTNEIFGKIIDDELCWYLPYSVYTFLDEPASTGTVLNSIWEYYVRNNIWTSMTGKPVIKKVVKELATAGNDGFSRALIGYPNSDEVWEMGLSIPPRVINIMDEGRYFKAPLEYKTSYGLNVKRPGGLLYIDNIFLNP